MYPSPMWRHWRPWSDDANAQSDQNHHFPFLDSTLSDELTWSRCLTSLDCCSCWYAFPCLLHVIRALFIICTFISINLLKDYHLGLNLCMLGNFSCFFVVCRLFQDQLFRKILSGTPSECQTVWTQIRPDKMSGLIWVQTVCKSYQQMTLVGKELKPCFLFEQAL